MNRLFPGLPANFRFARVDLDREARRWFAASGIGERLDNPLLDPERCQRFVDDLHRRLGVDGSFGGWLEDRRVLWRGSYLDADGRYVHVGVDVTVPPGMNVALPWRCDVLRVDDDHPEPHGWGSRIIVRPEGTDEAVILAHVSPTNAARVGRVCEAGCVIARVGSPPRNGGWFPHLHVQRVSRGRFDALLENDLRDLDGYGMPADVDQLAEDFPDPLPLLASDG